MVVRSHEGREPVAPARVERTGARPVTSRPRTRAASGLRPAANTSRPPGAWPPGPERSPTFVRNDEAGGEYSAKRGPTPKENAATARR
jgi:hypothetical protein